MNQKISPPVAIVIVIVLLVIVWAGVHFFRQSTGADVTDEMHAAMRNAKPGQPPFSRQQMEQMRRQGGANAPAPGSRP